jgi:hypothetical protein
MFLSWPVWQRQRTLSRGQLLKERVNPTSSSQWENVALGVWLKWWNTYLPSKDEALSSDPSTFKKKKVCSPQLWGHSIKQKTSLNCHTKFHNNVDFALLTNVSLSTQNMVGTEKILLNKYTELGWLVGWEQSLARIPITLKKKKKKSLNKKIQKRVEKK